MGGPLMDDAGVADAFYTVLSIGIVLVAAVAVSGVVLSATMKQGKDVASAAAPRQGMEKGLYGFYYDIDTAQSDPGSADSNAIVLKRLALERIDGTVALSAAGAPSGAPEANGAVIWSGYLYAPANGEYVFELQGTGHAWMWLDGQQVAFTHVLESKPPMAITLRLTGGYHPIKLKFAYLDLDTAACALSWQRDGNMVLVDAFYR